MATSSDKSLLPLMNVPIEPATCATAGAPRHLSSEQQKQMDEALLMLAPMNAFREKRLHDIFFEGGRKVSSLRDMSEWLANQHATWVDGTKQWKPGWSPKSFLQKYRLLKSARGDHSALARRARSDRGLLRSLQGRPELQQFIAAAWFTHQNVSAIADAVKRESQRFAALYGRDWTPPSYSAIDRFIASIPEAVRDTCILPKQKADGRNAPYLATRRGLHAKANQIWVGDHRIFDILLYNDFYQHVGDRVALRIWGTAFLDMRTRVIVGWAWSVSPSWRSIASALRQGLSVYGKPEICYVDNGKDFRKIGAGAQHGSLLTPATRAVPDELDEFGRVTVPPGLLARLGISASHCVPYHPQSKSIESYFSYVSKRFDRLFFKRGYTGSKPEARSDFCREAEHAHHEFLAGKRSSTPLMGTREFMALHAQWLLEYNTTHHHTGVGMDGRTPLEVMNELHPADQRQIPNMVQLEPLFWDRQVRTVANCEVQLDNLRYFAAPGDEQSQANMYLANGTEIAIHRDPEDATQALAVENKSDGALLARLVTDQLQTLTTEEDVRAICRQRARLRKASRQAIATLTYGVPTELELLQQRATGTADAQPAAAGVAPRARPTLRTEPLIVSDAVAQDAHLWKTIELEDDSPAVSRQDARGVPMLPPRRSEILSPFVDDAANEFIAAMREDEKKEGE